MWAYHNISQPNLPAAKPDAANWSADMAATEKWAAILVTVRLGYVRFGYVRLC